MTKRSRYFQVYKVLVLDVHAMRRKEPGAWPKIENQPLNSSQVKKRMSITESIYWKGFLKSVIQRL